MNVALMVTLSPEGTTPGSTSTHRRYAFQERRQEQDTPGGGREGVNRFTDHRNWNGELSCRREGASSSIGKNGYNFQGRGGHRYSMGRGESTFKKEKNDHRNWNGEFSRGRGATRGGGGRYGCRLEAHGRQVERRTGIGRTIAPTPPSSCNIGGGRGRRGREPLQYNHATAFAAVKQRYNR